CGHHDDGGRLRGGGGLGWRLRGRNSGRAQARGDETCGEDRDCRESPVAVHCHRTLMGRGPTRDAHVVVPLAVRQDVVERAAADPAGPDSVSATAIPAAVVTAPTTSRERTGVVPRCWL